MAAHAGAAQTRVGDKWFRSAAVDEARASRNFRRGSSDTERGVKNTEIGCQAAIGAVLQRSHCPAGCSQKYAAADRQNCRDKHSLRFLVRGKLRFADHDLLQRAVFRLWRMRFIRSIFTAACGETAIPRCGGGKHEVLRAGETAAPEKGARQQQCRDETEQPFQHSSSAPIITRFDRSGDF